MGKKAKTGRGWDETTNTTQTVRMVGWSAVVMQIRNSTTSTFHATDGADSNDADALRYAVCMLLRDAKYQDL